MRKAPKVKQFGHAGKKRKPSLKMFEVAILELKPGDFIVLRTDMVLSREQIEVLRGYAEQQFSGIKVVILTAGLSLAVVHDKREAA